MELVTKLGYRHNVDNVDCNFVNLMPLTIQTNLKKMKVNVSQ